MSAMEILEDLFVSVAAGSHDRTAKLLRLIAESDECPFNVEFLQANAKALESDNWSDVSRLYVNERFMGPSGAALMVGDYITRRDKRADYELSAILFDVGRENIKPGFFNSFIYEIFDTLEQPVSHILPITLKRAAGGLRTDESSEAFIVPDGWRFDVVDGPALNDTSKQGERAIKAKECINKIFDQRSANLLLSFFQSGEHHTEVQSMEFQVHDAGHATGIGLRSKQKHGLLNNGWHRGVEEWRSDGVAFEIASRAFSEQVMAEIVASNLLTRFGIDAHRAGRKSDTDYNCCLLSFVHLLEGGCVDINREHKIMLTKPTPRGLLQAVELMRAEAVAITRKELHVRKPSDIVNLYGSVTVEDGSMKLFESVVVEPCEGIYTELQ